jgi:hypothetical protein
MICVSFCWGIEVQLRISRGEGGRDTVPNLSTKVSAVDDLQSDKVSDSEERCRRKGVIGSFSGGSLPSNTAVGLATTADSIRRSIRSCILV